MKFFFLVDIFSLLVIIYSSTVTDISLFITMSFLKLIMIVKVTDLVVNYKAWSRKRLMMQVKAMKEKQKKMHSHGKKHDRAYQLKHGLLRKTTNTPLSKEPEPSILKTGQSSLKSQRVSRYSNVNIAMLNSMKSIDTENNTDIENTLSKQTKLEKRVSFKLELDYFKAFCVMVVRVWSNIDIIGEYVDYQAYYDMLFCYRILSSLLHLDHLQSMAIRVHPDCQYDQPAKRR
jgi:hypothetical protein